MPADTSRWQAALPQAPQHWSYFNFSLFLAPARRNATLHETTAKPFSDSKAGNDPWSGSISPVSSVKNPDLDLS
jgi:hypothetical protein